LDEDENNVSDLLIILYTSVIQYNNYYELVFVSLRSTNSR